MPTDTQVNELIINVLTQEQYNGIENPSNSELYLVPDVVDTTPTPGSTNTITSDGVYEYIHSISWYGTSSTPASTVQKEVSIPSITKLINGQIIIVKPTITSTVANSTLKLNNFNAYPMRYDNAAITTSTNSIVWNEAYPSVWVFDGNYWVFVAHGVDSNTTYSVMSVSEGTTGTATSSRVVRADYLKQIIQNSTPHALSELLDVAITSPSYGQSLVYDETIFKWVNTEIDMSLVENTTYSQLVSKIAANSGAGSLEPGKLYRITDYVTTTKNGENPDITSYSITYKSAMHQFDLIVMATSPNKLDCQAKVILHSGDTYFSTSDLFKWQVWYDINNNTNKYDWADSTNGKGVIYRMIDERNNECSYDFKNILFKRKLTNGEYDPDSGTLTWVYTFGKTSDASINNNNCYNNILKERIIGSKYVLSDIVFLGINCYRNTFGNNCCINTFGGNCYDNTFWDSCYDNTFGGDCFNNNFGNNCYSNTFGNNCSYNTFGDNCYNSTFGDYCSNNTFGDYCSYNTFGGDCFNNTFGYNCYDNIFGVDCSTNTFGNFCSYNTFGDNCYNSTFGDYCSYNTFGDSNNQNGNYIRFVIIKSGNQYIRLYNSSTASDSNYLQNIYIAQGVNSSSTYLDISTIARNLNYRTTVAKLSNGTIRIYKEDEDDMLPSMNGNAGKVLTVNSNETGAEWNTIVFPDVDKVKQVLSVSDVYGRLMITANNTSTASGSIVNNAVAYSYYSDLIMANPTTGDVVSNTFRAKGNDVYIGSSTNSQCHQQYDATNKCLKFIFD